jgi:hypothetical protein
MRDRRIFNVQSKRLAKLLLIIGAALVFTAIASTESVSFPEFTFESFLAATGLTVLIAGFLALV